VSGQGPDEGPKGLASQELGGESFKIQWNSEKRWDFEWNFEGNLLDLGILPGILTRTQKFSAEFLRF